MGNSKSSIFKWSKTNLNSVHQRDNMDDLRKNMKEDIIFH